MKNAIKDYLADKSRWKDFITEKMNDLENATLINLDVTVGKENKSNCEYSIDISYNILEKEFSSYGSGIAKFFNKKNNIVITGIKKI